MAGLPKFEDFKEWTAAFGDIKLGEKFTVQIPLRLREWGDEDEIGELSKQLCDLWLPDILTEARIKEQGQNKPHSAYLIATLVLIALGVGFVAYE